MVNGVDRPFPFIELAATDGAAAIRILPACHYILFAILSLIVKGDEQAGPESAGGFIGLQKRPAPGRSSLRWRSAAWQTALAARF
jgi:hypothetical protein